jgi:hypothetical protein
MGLVSAYFDESGKFKDHKIVSFGGVASYADHFNEFARQWDLLRIKNGLTKEFSAKQIFNPNRPLSDVNQRIGVESRIEDLMPFIACIRKHLLVISVIAIDVYAYKRLPQVYHQFFGTDPVFTSFTRSLLNVVDFTPPDDKIAFICDDEEYAAAPFYKLYRRVKRVWPQAKDRFIGITFADDRWLPGLQAGDLVSAIVRLEVARRKKRMRYDYIRLYEALTQPPQQGERLWQGYIAIGDKLTLNNLAEDLKGEWEKMQKKPKVNEFEKFDQTMKRLIAIPHSEIKAKLDAEKAKKRKAKPSASDRAPGEKG